MSSSAGERPGADSITAEQFEQAAIASGRTMLELANLIGVGRSTIHMYRNQGVTRPRTVEQVRRVMGVWLRDEAGNPYEAYTDDDLVREVQRRLHRVQDLLSRTSSQAEGVADTTSEATPPGDGSGRYTGTGGPA